MIAYLEDHAIPAERLSVLFGTCDRDFVCNYHAEDRDSQGILYSVGELTQWCLSLVCIGSDVPHRFVRSIELRLRTEVAISQCLELFCAGRRVYPTRFVPRSQGQMCQRVRKRGK